MLLYRIEKCGGRYGTNDDFCQFILVLFVMLEKLIFFFGVEKKNTTKEGKIFPFFRLYIYI